MSFPLFLLLIPLGLTIALFIAMAFSAIYHIFRFEFVNFFTVTLVIIFILGSAIILNTGLNHINKINWQKRITVNLFQVLEPPSMGQGADEAIIF